MSTATRHLLAVTFFNNFTTVALNATNMVSSESCLFDAVGWTGAVVTLSAESTRVLIGAGGVACTLIFLFDSSGCILCNISFFGSIY